MPDLMTQFLRWCITNETWSMPIVGKTGTYTVSYGKLPKNREYEYGYSCTCKAFERGGGKECKHILQAKSFHCLWNHEAVCGSSLPTPKSGKCPRCGGDLTTIAIGV